MIVRGVETMSNRNVAPPIFSLLHSMAQAGNRTVNLNHVGPGQEQVHVQSPLVLSPQQATAALAASASSQESSIGPRTKTSSTQQTGENDCNYRDYSQVPADPNELCMIKSLQEGCRDKTKKQSSAMNFPAKLHDMLSREEFSDVIVWSPHGRSWRVLKPKLFEQRVLPEYFRHSKYNSFMRQVNGWGFRRISQGPDFNSYYHELFLKGMPHLCRRMRRVSAIVNRADGEVAYDPDFRMMPCVGTSHSTSLLDVVTTTSNPAVSIAPNVPRSSPNPITLPSATIEETPTGTGRPHDVMSERVNFVPTQDQQFVVAALAAQMRNAAAQNQPPLVHPDLLRLFHQPGLLHARQPQLLTGLMTLLKQEEKRQKDLKLLQAMAVLSHRMRNNQT